MSRMKWGDVAGFAIGALFVAILMHCFVSYTGVAYFIGAVGGYIAGKWDD